MVGTASRPAARTAVRATGRAEVRPAARAGRPGHRPGARGLRAVAALAGAAMMFVPAACGSSGSDGNGGTGGAVDGNPVASQSTSTGGERSTPAWGFARFTDATAKTGAAMVVPAAASAGSWRSATSAQRDEQVRVVHQTTGSYRVTFPGLAVPDGRGIALVTALDPAGAAVAGTGVTAPVVSCHVVRWGAAGRAEQVDLTCRDAAGAAADSAFTALFTHVPQEPAGAGTPSPSAGSATASTAASTGSAPSSPAASGTALPVTGAGSYAYLRLDDASAPTARPADAYSVSGPGTIEVRRVGAGHYTIDLIGPAFAKNGNNLQVNAIGDGPVGCNALGRVVGTDRQSVFVGCARGSTQVDSPFVLLYTSGHALIPLAQDAASFGHAFTGVTRQGGPTQQAPIGPPVNAWGWYSANSTGATNQVRRLAVGRYEVSFPGIARTPDLVAVTPYGEPTARCSASDFAGGDGSTPSAPAGTATGTPAGTATVTVRCVDAAGHPADSFASVAYTTAAGPTG
ncbi:hypothetical protein [Frankia sp. R82]|uniref:hypothetical protein n=1 Tax=Frankia sp. R82 TaxID=2950553 RepID=UPI002043EEF8|nr:hypothetical protein [Frankia sp. R82]MCM3884835.1 hypothetical protein [Frankia sp. R82]